ncbi:MAG: phosphate ABC transporter ATP-binding protein PstB [Sulfobacillus sp.]|nr:phosphate ABC transporter ATP-binding protein PstB [Sulfobacillus sp.]
MSQGGPVPPSIEVDKLSVWYGSQRALAKVSLRIPAGHVLALIGPSGCGKTTFLRTLNRMVERTPGVRIAGRVTIGSMDVLAPGLDLPALRRKVGMVFQSPNPFPFTIFDNVAYGPRIAGMTDPHALRLIVEKSLKQASLWDEVRGKLRRSALTLSGGQQQRLCIARALAVEPDVLLMDEPTAALDPVSTAKIEELIRVLRSRYTIVVVTHNLQQAARISDYTAFFAGGELIEVGPTRKMFTAPDDPRTEAYLTGRYEGYDGR